MTASPTFEDARAAVAAHLAASSAGHCERVSAMARTVAEAYGVDPEAAALAGMLHDWDRDEDDAALLSAAERRGLPIDAAERARPYLLHARTGAAALRAEMPDVPADVLKAIEEHTVGSAEMSDLAKVLYVADTIEPGRSWAGVEAMRESVGRVDLDELFTRAYQRTLSHIIEKRKRLHPRTLEVWNSLVGERTR